MLDFASISPETKVLLLLCNRLGATVNHASPLSPAEFRNFAQWLDQYKVPLSTLSSETCPALTGEGGLGDVFASRIADLLGRTPELVRSLTRWSELGIWVIGERDADYPSRLAERLKASAPPLLYGSGNRDLLRQGGICVVGSRDSSADGLRFARSFGTRCGSEGLTVISSDMRGVDREVISVVLGCKSKVICVLSDSLEKTLCSRRFRDFVNEDNLVLVTPYSPEVRFRVGNAVRVNRYQYCLSDLAIIVETRRKGGLWTGAEENRRQDWVPGFVRAGDNVPQGNTALLHLGYLPIGDEEIDAAESLQEYLLSRMTRRTFSERRTPPRTVEARPENDLFEHFLACWLAKLGRKTVSPAEIACVLELEAEQVKSWIDRGVRTNRLVLQEDMRVKLADSN